MAITGAEPISAENLAAVLLDALKKPAREVLQTLEVSQYGEQNPVFYADPKDFGSIEVSCMGTGESTSFESSEVYVITCPLSEGSHDIGYAEKCRISKYGSGQNLWRVNTFGLSVFRIVGIRSGGGQLIADVLAALKGVA